jgi:signal transduction histidine kinase/CheY-like chemotaxis protein
MSKDMGWSDGSTEVNPFKAGQAAIEKLTVARFTAAACAAAIGSMVLIGWGFGMIWLIRPALHSTATNPLTALCLLLAALALSLCPRQRVRSIRLLAAIIVTLATTRLAANLTGMPLGIDRLPFADQLIRFRGAATNDMTPGSAIALILIGCALFLSGSLSRRATLVAQVQCGIAMSMGMFVVVAYALFHASLMGVINFEMSLYSALGFMALAAGTACINADIGIVPALLNRGAAGMLARAAIPVALLACIIVGTAEGTTPQIQINLGVTFVLLAGCVVALFRIDRLRRSRERATELSESYYRHAEQVGHIGHWLVEYPTGAVTWSDEYYKICGLPRDTEPNLETALALNHPDDAMAAREIAQAVKDGRGWEIGLRIRRPDGEVRYIKSHGVCEHGPNGDVIAIFGVFADVTELEFAQREAEAATASKAAFLANMSHEIRTPMNGVMGFVELLMESKLDAKQRRHLLLVQESAQALLKLLNDILDLSKIDAGQLDLSAEPCNLRHDITQCVRLMTPAAEQKGLELKAAFADPFPDTVLMDSLRFRQVLFNLLGNAVKFTSEGTVSVTLAETIGPGGRRTMEVKVADTGVGIAPERKAAIFDAFVQADASVSRRFGGSGLGLSISRSLAVLMGGTISLESKENEGTLVTLTLPLDEVFAPALADVQPFQVNPAAIALAVRPRQASILLVEDIDINQELITEMLNLLGHRVDLAKNGSEALSLAHRLKGDPGAWDMILMDVQMPIMDGLTATRCIRALGGRAATIPIVALTANAFATEMQDCRDAGMDDHIAKPSGFSQLKQAVELWGNVAEAPTPPAGFGALETVSVADRFQTRLRKSQERLTELTAELSGADAEAALQLMREAGGIAHVLAGTAGMFGRASLGKVAQLVEVELKEIACGQPTDRTARAGQAIGRLVTALDGSASTSGARSPASVVSNF